MSNIIKKEGEISIFNMSAEIFLLFEYVSQH